MPSLLRGMLLKQVRGSRELFGVLVDASVMLDSVVAKPPAKNRWGAATQTSAAISLGIMVHQIFPQGWPWLSLATQQLKQLLKMLPKILGMTKTSRLCVALSGTKHIE